MPIKFDHNIFYHAAGNAQPVVKKRIQFSYGSSVTRISFNQAYDVCQGEKGAIARKAIALPKVLLSVARMVANLGYLIILGLPPLLVGNVKPLKCGAFRFVRNGEILAGHFLTIFNDRLGRYLVERGHYNKTCYSLSMNQSFKNGIDEGSIEKKCDQLIQLHKDANEPDLLIQDIRKTFKGEKAQFALQYLLKCAIQEHNHDLFMKIVKSAGVVISGPVKIQFALLLLEEGNVDQFNDEIDTINFYVQENKQALRDTIKNQLDAGHVKTALKLLKKHPYDTAYIEEVYAKIAQIHMDKGDYENVLHVITKMPYMSDKANQIRIRCATHFYETGDVKKAIEVLSNIRADFTLKKQELTKLCEKCIDADQLDHAKMIIDHIAYDVSVNCVNKLVGKYVDREMFAEAHALVKLQLNWKGQEEPFLILTKALIKHPQFKSYKQLLTDICEDWEGLFKKDHLIVKVAFEFLRAGDEINTKRALSLLIGHLLQKVNFHSWEKPTNEEKEKLAEIQERLFNENYASIKILLDQQQLIKVEQLCRKIVDNCKETVRKPKPQPHIDPENFFNHFFNGANFYQGNPFRNAFNFNLPVDKNLPQEVAKLKPLEIKPKAPILLEYYNKCLDAEPKNYHQIIGLAESFTQDELKKASRTILVKIHPDKHPEEKDAANEITSVITCIWRALEPMAKNAV